MPDIAIMVEGQHGVNWDNWRTFGPRVEELGFVGLFRSDHFTNPDGPFQDALDLWPSLTWLADHTDSIDFGPLVTPMSFRHPVFTARMGKDVDNLAGGRLVLGVGAGWQEREHETFGFDLLDLPERFDRFEEGVEVIAGLLREEEVSFDGEYYQLDGAKLVPRPDREGGTRLSIGGNGRNRTMPLAATYADEWNAMFSKPEEYAELREHFDGLVADAVDRDPEDVVHSMMTPLVFGRDEAEVDRVLEEVRGGADAADYREAGGIVGTAETVTDHLERLDDAGLDRVMLQWLALDELDRFEAFADAVL